MFQPLPSEAIKQLVGFSVTVGALTPVSWTNSNTSNYTVPVNPAAFYLDTAFLFLVVKHYVRFSVHC